MQRAVYLLLLFALSVTGRSAVALNGKIVFNTNSDGNTEVYVMDANGNHIRNLTQHPARDIAPAWSPDGSQILFDSYRDGNGEIYVMDADGSNPRNLTRHPALDCVADWSPDGTQILFLSNRAGGINTYIMDADGQNIRRLTNYPPEGEFADISAWSPDGEQIAFEWVRALDTGIYLMNTNGRNIRPVSLPEKGIRKGGPRWSPDGQQIAYVAWKDNSIRFGRLMLATRLRGDIWESKRLPLPKELALGSVRWSPDGEHLLFCGGDMFGGGNKELPGIRIRRHIYRYTFRTREVVQLTNIPGWYTGSPDWSAHALSVSPTGNVATYWGRIKAKVERQAIYCGGRGLTTVNPLPFQLIRRFINTPFAPGRLSK